MIGVFEGLELLRGEGFPVVKSLRVSSRPELLGALKRVGFPCVLKIDSGAHKTERGGVFTDVSGVKDALKVFGKLKRLSENVVVQSQVSGLELVLGVKLDSVFGPVVMLGLGGVFVEVLKDVSLRVCPVSKFDALAMIDELKANVLLRGYRGKEGVDVNVLAGLIVKLSEFAVKMNVKSLDLNPVIGKGRNVLLVDARIDL